MVIDVPSQPIVITYDYHVILHGKFHHMTDILIFSTELTALIMLISSDVFFFIIMFTIYIRCIASAKLNIQKNMKKAR